MANTVRTHLTELLESKKLRDNYLAVFIGIALVVASSVALLVKREGLAATHEVTVLDCHYDGNGAHTHNADCYDADGNLVCPLPERELHIHDDSCYTEQTTLICGLEEGEEHVHTSECYQTERILSCGKEEVTEEHVHGPGCFTTITVNDGEEPVAAVLYPEQSFNHEFKNEHGGVELRVDVHAPEGALPEGTTMRATMVDPNSLNKQERKAVDNAIAEKTDGVALEMQAVDITFLDAQGNEIEPKQNVTVTFTSPLVTSDDQAVVVHVESEKQMQERGAQAPKGEVMEALPSNELSKRDMSLSDDQLAFDSNQFSTYVLATASREQTMKASTEDTTVTVDAPADAGVSASANLQATEILSTDEGYASYVEEAVKALGLEEDADVSVRLFNIAIVDEQGGKVEIAAPVTVRINMAGKEGDVAQVVHFAGESETPQVIEEVLADGEAVSFTTDGFSVYAVVGEGDTSPHARMKVNFWNGSEKIATAYVKNSDSLAALETILFDPGVGETGTPAGATFKGWLKEKPDYTLDDLDDALDIAEVRSWAESLLIAEGTEVNFYAVFYKTINVTYLDERSISLGNETMTVLPETESVTYTVNMSYTPDDPTKNFEGWNVYSGSSNIEGYTEGTVYENGQSITISGDVIFSVEAPTGRWLVFDENGKGATYNAPQFVKSGEVTHEPALEMSRFGYTFGGWYKDRACTAGNEFNFGETLTDNTTIYAKWNPVSRANYTVLIWKQNVAGDGYDFAESILIENGVVGSTINTVTRQGTGNNAYARVDGVNKQYTGFHLNNFDQNVTIAPEGTSVLNVYYDRNIVTLNFYTFRPSGSYTRYNFDDSTYSSAVRYYYRVDNGWYANPRYTYVSVHLARATDGRYYWFDDSGRARDYLDSNNIYIRNGSWRLYQSTSGRFESLLSDNGFTWPSSYNWYETQYPGGGAGGTRITFLDAYLPPNPTVTTYNVYGQESEGDVQIRFYKQDSDNPDNYILANTVNASGGNFYITDKYHGFVASWYRVNGGAWQSAGTKDSEGVYNNGQPVSYTTGLDIFFDRLSYPILYMDGVYVDGNNNPVAGYSSRGQLNQVDDVTYGSNISSYNKGGANYYEPTYDGFAFDGWYLDSACTQPYTFTTMPEGITVFAKWRQVQYRVFLHPNVPNTDTTLSWGSSTQGMSFRVSDGGKISLPTGTRQEYELIGWYLDEECTLAYPAGYVLNSTTVTTPYDKTVDMTDPMDKYGEGATTNGDLNRSWITKKLDVYAKWRKILVGADGIGIIYNANGGSNEPSDNHLYLDQATAVAQSAPKPPAGKIFKCWVVQAWDEAQNKYVDTEVSVYPGDTYTVLEDNARRVPKEDHTDDNPSYTYTVQLRAEYIDSGSKLPTHIYFYANTHDRNGVNIAQVDQNNEPKDVTTYREIQINEAVDILDINDIITSQDHRYDGLTFLGWAKERDAHDPWLKWNGDGTYTVKQDGITYTDITQIAADEENPIDNLYAVWERWGYLKIGKHFDVQEFYLDGKEMEALWHTLEFTIQDSEGNYVKVVDDPKTERAGNYIYDGKETEKTTVPLSAFVRETGSSATHEHQYFLYVWLPVDTYTVAEDKDEADKLLTGYERQDSPYSATGTVSNDCTYGHTDNIGSGEVRIDNNYRGSNNYAYLKVTKQVEGDAPTSLTADKDFYFIVKNTTLNAYVSTTERTFTTDPAKIQVFKLKPGGELYYANTGNMVNGNHIQVIGDCVYEVIELDTMSEPVAAPASPQIAGYLWEQSVSPETVKADKESEKTLSITNTYTARYGSLKLTKLLDEAGDIPAGASDRDYLFTVTNADGLYVADENGTLVDELTMLRVKPGDANALTINNLEPGEYQVTELVDDIPTYRHTVSVKVGSGEAEEASIASATVVKGETVEVAFTNTYERIATDIYLNKVDKANQSKLLAGSTFKLYRKDAEGTYAADETIDATKAATTLVLTDGTLKVEGLPSGDYKLTETKAPAGYIILSRDIYFTVNAEAEDGGSVIVPTPGQTPYTDDSIGASTKNTSAGKTDDTLVIPNTAGEALPHTGGPGTYGTYIIGIGLLLLAGVILRAKQKRTA